MPSTATALACKKKTNKQKENDFVELDIGSKFGQVAVKGSDRTCTINPVSSNGMSP